MAGAMSSGRTAACSAQWYGFSTEYSSSIRPKNAWNRSSGTPNRAVTPVDSKISHATPMITTQSTAHKSELPNH